MAKSTIKKNSKFIIIGGGGLVGRSFLVLLLKKGFRNISVISLKSKRVINNLQSLQKRYNVPIKQYWANVLVPKKLKQYTIKQIIMDPKRNRSLQRYLEKPFNSNKIENESVLFQIIKDEKPNYIVDCINSATQCSYINYPGKSFEGSGIGLNMLLRFYQVISHLLNDNFWKQKKIKMEIDTYLKIGTTGIGGMGLDMPFTHGEEKPSMSLLKKVAMAGAQQMILFAMQNNRSKVKIMKIVPATAIFSKNINGTINNENHLNIDGGESGGYSLEEFRLLSDPKQMGFIDSESLAIRIFNVLSMNDTKKNVLTSFESGVIRPTKRASKIRKDILSRGSAMLKERDLECIAHGNLGPKRVQKMLYESKIFGDFFIENRKKFFNYKPKELSSIISKKIKKNLKLTKEIRASQLSVKYQVSRIQKHTEVNNDDIIDLRSINCKKWQHRFKKLGFTGKKRTVDQPGKIVSRLIQINDF